MNFSEGRRRRHGSEVSTGALTDIMFFLMIFFLIVSTLTNPNVIKLLLPEASSSNTISKQSITISITKDLKYYINKKEVTLEELEGELTAQTQGVKEPTIVLRVERDVPVEYLVKVLDMGMKLQIKVVLATQRA